MRVWPLKDTGGVMDIQEEKADFEADFRKTDFYKMNLVNCFCFINDRYVWDEVQAAWEMWQASKAKTVPEGFGDIQSWIAVNSFSALDAVHENVPIIDANELAKYIDNLIEAQEQSHD